MSLTPVHLDTSFLIRALRPGTRQDQMLRALLEASRELAMSSIAWAEFLCGPLNDRQLAIARRITSELIPFTDKDAALTAELFNESGRRRSSLTDCMIAATALRCNARLATANQADFKRLRVALVE
ncbi:MAG: PIN domain-containing protein [Thermoanaerobaculia bacterium]